MERIASFSVNHDRLHKGMYISRVDGDVVTYDIRMKKPNGGDYLGNGELHTFEHLFATYARNSAYRDSVIYVGPMGCRTGFYLLLREEFPERNGRNAETGWSTTWPAPAGPPRICLTSCGTGKKKT